MRIRILVAFSLVLVLSLSSLFCLPLYGASIFNDGFESGDFSAWSGTNAPTYATVEVVSAPVHHGIYSCHLSNTAHDVEPKVWKDFASIDIAYARVYVRFANLGWSDTKRAIFFTLGMAAYPSQTSQVSVYNDGGTYVWRLDMLDDASTAYSSTSTQAFSLDTWYCVEVKKVADATAGECRLYIDGTELLSITGKDTDSTGKCDRFLIDGETYGEVALTNNYFDCAVVADAYIGPEPSDTIPPTFGNISTNTTTAGQLCTFSCLVNDNENVSTYTFSSNNTGAWTNDTTVAFSSFYNESAAWANVTKTLNDTVGNVVSYMWYANDTSDNWSHSDQYNLTTSALQRHLTVVSPYGTPGGQGWYNNGSTAYATLNTGIVDEGNGTRRVFINWSGDASGTSFSQSDPITMDENKTAVAVWKTQHLLGVLTDPSEVAPSPTRNPLGEEGPTGWWYDASTNVTLTAQSITGYNFTDWDVDGILQGDGVNPITLTMNGPSTAKAHYTLLPPLIHDIAVTKITSTKTVIGQSSSVLMNVTVENQGETPEDFNVTIYANSTQIGTQLVIALGSNTTKVLTFTWNTNGFGYGHYGITVSADVVANETDTADNSLTRHVILTIPGDVNGDFIVDIYDAITLSGVYNHDEASPDWNSNVDLNGDGIIDIYDAIILAGNYGKQV